MVEPYGDEIVQFKENPCVASSILALGTIFKIMEITFKIIQIILAILLVIVVLMQQRGSGLGMAFGGDSGGYRSRRGVEQILHIATIVIATLFCVVALLTVFFTG